MSRATRSALVVGGTGPTGPRIVEGLRERGFRVTIFHRGTHEANLPNDVSHIHGDPTTREGVEAALKDTSWSVVVSMYGSLRSIVAITAGNAEIFIGITGLPVYRGYTDGTSRHPFGVRIPVREAEHELANTTSSGIGARVRRAEEVAMETGNHRGTGVCLIRYPQVYGPRAVVPFEWSVIKRVLDGRDFILFPDASNHIVSRVAAQNAASAVLAAIDKPNSATGEVFHIADRDQFTLRQWAEIVSSIAGRRLDVIDVPAPIGKYFWDLRAIVPSGSPVLLDTSKIESALGYIEPIPALSALERTVKWYMENPVDLEDAPAFTDRFRYDLEDEVLHHYRKCLAKFMSRYSGTLDSVLDEDWTFPYAHKSGDISLE